MKPPKIAQRGPYLVKLEAGRSYYWCACGRSFRQPFCDASHAGSGHGPVRYRAEETGVARICGCKQTKTPPYCDGSHERLSETVPESEARGE